MTSHETQELTVYVYIVIQTEQINLSIETSKLHVVFAISPVLIYGKPIILKIFSTPQIY